MAETVHQARSDCKIIARARKRVGDFPILIKMNCTDNLVGGVDIERLEAILQGSKVDFIASCRPLIREPDLPNRWREGIGKRVAECIEKQKRRAK